MKKESGLDSALNQLRRAVDEERSRAEKVEELSGLLNEVMNERSAAVESALSALRGYVRYQTGVKDPVVVDEAVADKICAKSSTRKKAKKKKKTTKKTKKVTKKSKRSHAPEVMPSGYPHDIGNSFSLSPVEQKLVDLLTTRWPRFTTPSMLVKAGIIPEKTHATCKVNQLRKKGVPIESARQARNNGDKVSEKAKGYRLMDVIIF